MTTLNGKKSANVATKHGWAVMKGGKYARVQGVIEWVKDVNKASVWPFKISAEIYGDRGDVVEMEVVHA